jgi:hypothetical protein
VVSEADEVQVIEFGMLSMKFNEKPEMDWLLGVQEFVGQFGYFKVNAFRNRTMVVNLSSTELAIPYTACDILSTERKLFSRHNKFFILHKHARKYYEDYRLMGVAPTPYDWQSCRKNVDLGGLNRYYICHNTKHNCCRNPAGVLPLTGCH